MQEWIKCSDRLPEIKENGRSNFVLCYNITANNHMAAPSIWIFRLRDWGENWQQWSSKRFEWSFIGENNPGEITHWMPLPLAPKE
jgi:hypothetical protein